MKYIDPILMPAVLADCADDDKFGPYTASAKALINKGVMTDPLMQKPGHVTRPVLSGARCI